MGTLGPEKYSVEELAQVDVTGLAPLIDLDSHEMLPSHLWEAAFGKTGDLVAQLYAGMSKLGDRGGNLMKIDESFRDDTPLDPASVWTMKGPVAPGVIDLGRREAVMDTMGVDRQLMFPTFANIGALLRFHPDGNSLFGFDLGERDPVRLGTQIIEAWNTYLFRMIEENGSERIWPVGFLLTDSVEQMVADTQDMISRGVKAITFSLGDPPADTSPADTALDPFWSLLETASVAAVPHLGTTQHLLRSGRWNANVPAFVADSKSMVEFPLQPYAGATLNMGPDNFLSTMILGGTFERHPMLRFGVMEMGAQWVGHLAERLDLWAGEFEKRLPHLKMKPSEYMNRNVRATPFVFEDVKSYFEKYPSLSDVYCYSSDYPHVEGGKFSKQRFLLNLNGLDDLLIKKFFSENGAWIMP